MKFNYFICFESFDERNLNYFNITSANMQIIHKQSMKFIQIFCLSLLPPYMGSWHTESEGDRHHNHSEKRHIAPFYTYI